MSKLIPTIGIEVHCELKTKQKVFSNSLNTYGEVANTKINEIDLGYPGTLPTLNKEVINIGIKTALLLNCKINKEMHFDRKNYFYPDLPKGYQITQKRTPIGYDGFVEINIDGISKKIYIEEIHIEEDTCKSIHEKEVTYLDFNRAGIPLIEIVTKPVINNEKEAVLYLEKLREILLYGEISDVKIEEGSMRCDLNISLKEEQAKELGTKIEIKNIGSITNVALSIKYEKERQAKLIKEKILLTEETRKYDESKQKTVLMRKKESKNDYRYFPEPDIPSLIITEDQIEMIKKNLPILPDELRKKYKDLNINDIAIQALINNRDLNKLLLELLDLKSDPVISSNILTGDLLAYLKKNNIKLKETNIDAKKIKELVDLLKTNKISSKIGKIILNEILTKDLTIKEIIEKNNIKQIDDTKELEKIISSIIEENNFKTEYLNNPEKVLKFAMGLIMKQTKGQANPKIANEILKKLIK